MCCTCESDSVAASLSPVTPVPLKDLLSNRLAADSKRRIPEAELERPSRRLLFLKTSSVFELLDL
jgi:hypothetical protein